MKIRFHGAVNGHVTGSCTEFNFERTKTKFLVDCGMVQGEAHAQAINARAFPFSAADIKFVLLTHAHLDHCGLLPKLYKDGFRGKVLCTRATAALAEAILLDSAGLPESPYDTQDVRLVQFEAVDDRKDFGLSRLITIDGDIRAGFMRSAHILGSVSVSLSWLDSDNQWRQIVMSGDIGPNTKSTPYQSLLAGRQSPFAFPDYIVVESTYGDRERDPSLADRDARLNALDNVVRASLVNRAGTLVVPCFSLHRTQEVLFDLYCLYGREGAQSPFSAPLMCESDFEKLVKGESISKIRFDELERLIVGSDGGGDAGLLLAFKKSETKKGAVRYNLGDCSEKQREGLRHYATKVPVGQPLIVHLESPLAGKVSDIYRQRLKDRQIKNPEETLFRNRMLSKWLGVQKEEDVDEVFERLFSYAEANGKRGSVHVGGLTIRSGNGFKMHEAGTAKPTVVISSSGMCEGGPIVNLLSEVLRKESVTMLVTGYMSKGSAGAKIVTILNQPVEERSGKLQFTVIEQDGKKTVERAIELPATEMCASLADLSGYYSGHADLNGLCEFVLEISANKDSSMPARPVKVFLNHGSDEARNNLKRSIEERAGRKGSRHVASVELADGEGRWFDLEKGVYLVHEEGLEAKVDRLLEENLEIKCMLAELLERFRS